MSLEKARRFVERARLRASFIVSSDQMLKELDFARRRFRLPACIHSEWTPKRMLILSVKRDRARLPMELYASFIARPNTDRTPVSLVLDRAIKRLVSPRGYFTNLSEDGSLFTGLGKGYSFTPFKNAEPGRYHVHPASIGFVSAPAYAYRDFIVLLWCFGPRGPLREPERYGLTESLTFPVPPPKKKRREG